MDWLLNEFRAIPYIIGGVILLFIGMSIGDFFDRITDRLWKRKN